MNAIEGYKKLKALEGVSEAIGQLIDNEKYPDGEFLGEDVIDELRGINSDITRNIDKYRGALSKLELEIK